MITAPAAGQPATARSAARAAAGSRLLFVDNLRVFLTILVIMHHLLISYAGSGSWYYQETPRDFVTVAVGSWVLSVNQAFFMGFFLFIAAYFVPSGYDRKGIARFVKDRLVRLGIPLAFYSWVIAPVFAYLVLAAKGSPVAPFWRYFPQQYFGAGAPWIGPGPLWFIETLLLFSLIYAGWRFLRQQPSTGTQAAPFPPASKVALFAALLGLATFLVRLIVRVGWSFGPLNLQFPHFAQYVALFAAGLIAYRRGWLETLPDRTGRGWLAFAVIMIAAFVPIAIVLDAAANSERFQGGWSWHALVYALWESAVCVALCIGLTYLFRRHVNRQGLAARFLARSAYATFLIHAPVITFLAMAFGGAGWHPLLKFALLTTLSIPLCFGIGALLLRLPYADRVL